MPSLPVKSRSPRRPRPRATQRPGGGQLGSAYHRRPHAVPPAVIGIDDWAWRRNRRYGTIICDLERRRIIALLPDREPATAQEWLSGQTQIAVVARDRGGSYALAAAKAGTSELTAADAESLEQQLQHDPHDGLRLLAVTALACAAGPSQGWTPARRARLREYQRDPSPLVSGSAQFIFPPAELPPEPALPSTSPSSRKEESSAG